MRMVCIMDEYNCYLQARLVLTVPALEFQNHVTINGLRPCCIIDSQLNFIMILIWKDFDPSKHWQECNYHWRSFSGCMQCSISPGYAIECIYRTLSTYNEKQSKLPLKCDVSFSGTFYTITETITWLNSKH